MLKFTSTELCYLSLRLERFIEKLKEELGESQPCFLKWRGVTVFANHVEFSLKEYRTSLFFSENEFFVQS